MSTLNLKHFLKCVHHLPYMLIKTDVPYMPKDFPNTYPHKDMDMIVDAHCIFTMNEAITIFLDDYPQFDVQKKISSLFPMQMLFRLIDPKDTEHKFHYQFDISEHYHNLPRWYIEDSIMRRVEHSSGLYYVPSLEDELVYRLTTVLHKPKPKSWHVEYILEHKDDANLWLLKKLSLLEKYDEIIKR